MALAAFEVVYDVSSDWSQILVPIVLTSGWLVGLVGVPQVLWSWSEQGRHRLFALVWLAGWAVVGGVGFGNVWYQHVHCIRELKSGDYLVAEAPITYFRPEIGKASEKFTVGGETFEYYSANLGAGGMRYTGGVSGPLHVGAYVRVAYGRDRRILRLEIRQPDR
ncbi:MAG TPA: hypothetical protein VGI81_17515 [Tepidisphaeraceae bacterium]|jgi:hypothetical protein